MLDNTASHFANAANVDRIGVVPAAEALVDQVLANMQADPEFATQDDDTAALMAEGTTPDDFPFAGQGRHRR